MIETNSVPVREIILRQAGLITGPILALGLYLATANTLDEAARITAAIAVLMVVFWVTEALPIAVTALLPLALLPTLGVMSIQAAAAPFAKPVIFLFLGGFMIAAAVERCGLHTRLAYVVLRFIGRSSGQVLAGCMLATAFLSMWISNTAATVVMLPIATSLARALGARTEETATTAEQTRIDCCFLLGIAYAANIGGLGTIIGTPPNALLAGFLAEQGITLSFGTWMLFALPVVGLLLGACWLLLYRIGLNSAVRHLSVPRDCLDTMRKDLGPMSRNQWVVLAVFLCSVVLWMTHEPLSHWHALVNWLPAIAHLSDASIAMIAAVTLFLLPDSEAKGSRILDWSIASQLPWGVLILIGGGMSLGLAMSVSGLTEVMGQGLQAIVNLPLIIMILVVTGLVVFLTEVISNTAITAALLPVLFGLTSTLELEPFFLLVPATLAASCAFMLPVGTPPNAVVHSTGHVPTPTMMRYGLGLNVLATLLITAAMYLFGRGLLA